MCHEAPCLAYAWAAIIVMKECELWFCVKILYQPIPGWPWCVIIFLYVPPWNCYNLRVSGSFFGKSILGGFLFYRLFPMNHQFFLGIFQYRPYNLEITHLWKPLRAAQIDSPQKRSSHLAPALYRMLWRRRNSSQRFAWNHGKGCSRKIRSVKLNDTSRNFRSKEPTRLHKLSEWVQISALGAPLQTSSSFANMAPFMSLQ